MLRRWLIRTPLLLVLGFIVAAWVGSYFGVLGTSEYRRGNYEGFAVAQGLAEYFQLPLHDFVPPTGMFFRRSATARDSGFEPTTLGFHFGPYGRAEMPNSLQIIFPLWLPTLLLAGLNWFIWRKTRERKPFGAFPVEIPAK